MTHREMDRFLRLPPVYGGRTMFTLDELLKTVFGCRQPFEVSIGKRGIETELSEEGKEAYGRLQACIKALHYLEVIEYGAAICALAELDAILGED